ncbi:MAG TPA: hypothetical protein VGJ20_19270 [Xanthobacteraceae bacterium]
MVEEPSGISAEARVLDLDHGVYALSIAKLGEVESQHSGMLLPAVHISQPPAHHLGGAEIITPDGGPDCWLGCDGGTVVVKAPVGGGVVLVTSFFAPSGQPGKCCEISVRRIDGPAPAYATPGEAAAMPLARNISIEALLHIEGTGDRRMSAEGWIGNLGKKLRLEAFGIRPLETLAPGDIEYQAFGPSGRETPWISENKLCGTRGRGLPLTGFAIRIAPHLRDRFGIEYYGAFFESGICGPMREGEPCIAHITDDPLEAINVRLFERVASPTASRPGPAG